MPTRFLYGVLLFSALALWGVFLAPKKLQAAATTLQSSGTTRSVGQTSNQSAKTTTATQTNSLLMRNQRIMGLDGSVAYQGDVDLTPVVARINRGERDKHPNDGAVYKNRSGSLPHKATGYYHEYVVRTPHLRGVGPQRLILGQGGEMFYTPDHYKTFIPLNHNN